MARTRGTANQANHELPSERKTDASGKKASATKHKKNKTAAQPQKVKQHEWPKSDAAGDNGQGKKNHLDDHSNDEEDFNMVESEEYDSEDYYPTKIAKKRDTQKLDAGENKGAVNKTAQKQLISEMSHKSQKSSSRSSSGKPPTATKVICIACHDAHAKCGKSDEPGQPCNRCARMGLECVFDPHYKRRGRRPNLAVGKTVKDKTTTTGQQSKDKQGDISDISSEDPLNSPAPTIRVASRQTKNKTRSGSGRFTKATRGSDLSPPSSPLSSAPEDSQDETDIVMAGVKHQANDNFDVPSTPNIRNKARTPRSAARKGPSPGIPAPNRDEANARLDDHDLSSSMTDIVPQKGPKPEVSNILPGNKPVPIESQDQGKEQEISCDDTADDSASNPGSVSYFHSTSPPPTATLFANQQQIKDFTLASPRAKQNTPTFLPKGHGSVLNPDMIPEQEQQQQQQHPSPLPPISQLGPGGTYRGRYDTTNLPPTPMGLTPGQASQVPIMTSSQILPVPPNIITNNNHALISATQRNTNTSPLTSSSDQADMPAPGSLAYRYSATKILFLLKHSQRAQLLAVGGASIAPDAIATLTHEMEDARSRALRLWYEMHNGLAVGEEVYE